MINRIDLLFYKIHIFLLQQSFFKPLFLKIVLFQIFFFCGMR